MRKPSKNKPDNNDHPEVRDVKNICDVNPDGKTTKNVCDEVGKNHRHKKTR